MQYSAFILTRTKAINHKNNHNDLQLFIDLVEACGFSTKISHMQPSHATMSKVDILFVDAEYASKDELFELSIVRAHPHIRKVIFNADLDNHDVHVTALKSGFAGILNKHDNIELMVRALQQLKFGNRWFSRDTMTQLIDQLISHYPKVANTPANSASILTKRELVITEQIAEGAQNQEIADKLHISVNTVKTHVYTIFRKTECRNRVELIRWYQDRYISPTHVSA